MKEGKDTDHLNEDAEGGVSQESRHGWRQSQAEEHRYVVDPAQEVDRLLREDQLVYHRLVLLDHREVVDHAQAHVGAQHEHQSCVERSMYEWGK